MDDEDSSISKTSSRGMMFNGEKKRRFTIVIIIILDSFLGMVHFNPLIEKSYHYNVKNSFPNSPPPPLSNSLFIINFAHIKIYPPRSKKKI